MFEIISESDIEKIIRQLHSIASVDQVVALPFQNTVHFTITHAVDIV
jgi:hypothetical protein